MQDCNNSIANALELLQSCTKPSIDVHVCSAPRHTEQAQGRKRYWIYIRYFAVIGMSSVLKSYGKIYRENYIIPRQSGGEQTMQILVIHSIVDCNCLHGIAKFMGPTWGPSGSCRTQMAPCWPHETCYEGTVLKQSKYTLKQLRKYHLRLVVIPCFWWPLECQVVPHNGVQLNYSQGCLCNREWGSLLS